MYKVQESDLIGDIKGFPIEVVQKMIERQLEQTGKCDISIFQDECFSERRQDGFTWSDSVEGDTFWEMVISDMNFEVFFKRYPKEQDKQKALEILEHHQKWRAGEIDKMEYSSKELHWALSVAIESLKQ